LGTSSLPRSRQKLLLRKSALVDMGVKKGDRVGMFMPNTPQFVMAYFGILKAGGVVVATNPLYTAPEIEHQASDAGIEIMFVMTNFYKTIKKAQPNTKIKKLIVTNLKETLPPVLRVLFTLAKEKKGGFRGISYAVRSHRQPSP
jgi:long-chain acyl-CoA synthetase